jgi:WD40 repeat protein
MGVKYGVSPFPFRLIKPPFFMESDNIREKVTEPEFQGLLPSSAPKYILRGHGAAIHAVRLFAQNLRLVSGDADGWIVVWDMVTKRSIVSWKAHQSAVLEVKAFQFGSVTEIYT